MNQLITQLEALQRVANTEINAYMGNDVCKHLPCILTYNANNYNVLSKTKVGFYIEYETETDGGSLLITNDIRLTLIVADIVSGRY